MVTIQSLTDNVNSPLNYSPWYVWLNDEFAGVWVKCSEAYESFDEAFKAKVEIADKSPHHEYTVMKYVIH
jgi:hypothetical protein